MKKLVTGKTVQDFANENKGKDFPVDEDTLITPNAKDKAVIEVLNAKGLI